MSTLTGGQSTYYVFIHFTDSSSAIIFGSGVLNEHTNQEYSLSLSPYAGKTIDYFEWENADSQEGTRVGKLYYIKIINPSPCAPENSLPSDQTWTKNSSCLTDCTQQQHFVADPINTFSGNYNYQATDFSISAVGQPLRFQRSYNSMPVTGTVVYSQPLGYGWTHNYDTRLTFPTDPGGEPATVILKAAAGSRMRFSEVSTGTYEAYPGVHAVLTRTGVTTSTYVYTVTAANQETYVFTTTGRLTKHLDPQGNPTVLGVTQLN
jgi:hypothetical protein